MYYRRNLYMLFKAMLVDGVPSFYSAVDGEPEPIFLPEAKLRPERISKIFSG
jgi:hypothetical protein